MHRAVAWIVALPLAAGATLAAHALDYRLVVPDAGARETLLAATGHGYADWIPLALGLATAAALGALACSAEELRLRAPRPPAWPFLLVPPLAFVCQEHLERLVQEGSFPWHAAAEPTFAPGLALTIPFGLVAFAVARIVLRVATTVARVLGRAPAQLPALLPVLRPRTPEPTPVRVLASRRTSRGPPRVG